MHSTRVDTLINRAISRFVIILYLQLGIPASSLVTHHYSINRCNDGFNIKIEAKARKTTDELFIPALDEVSSHLN